ncbi:MAG TPA: GGDEF domain-containing protein [Gammaproteobacteria bacterium]|nr:GGDEF domain-containing protein [Gammaproteobacteria bacterium]
MNINIQDDNSSKIRSALVAHVYQLIHFGHLASLFCATIILIGIYQPHENNTLLISWYIFYLIIFIVRTIFAKIYLKLKNPNVILWKNLFIIGTLLGGLTWGLAGSLLFIETTTAYQMLIILVIAGVTAGAPPLLSANLPSAFVFITTALAPLIFLLCFSELRSDYPFFGLAAICYYLYLMVLCVRSHDIIKNSISLKFENDTLITHISQTKNELEIINKKLTHAATHDPLTNLANRSLFEHNLTKAIERAKKRNAIFALLYIDLDNFKEINDAYGHHVGDELLLQLIERIRKNTRQTDLVSRLGGDELTIILENINHPEIIPMTANRLCNILSEPVTIHNDTIVVTASIGISVYPNDGKDVETLLKNADKAMYYVKEHGRNNFRFNS